MAFWVRSLFSFALGVGLLIIPWWEVFIAVVRVSVIAIVGCWMLHLSDEWVMAEEMEGYLPSSVLVVVRSF